MKWKTVWKWFKLF